MNDKMKEINLFNIKLADLELFLSAAKHGSFTRAGEELFMTQSWVSRRINQIENELGLTLFIRNKRNVVLTPAGRVLEQQLQNTTENILQAIQAAHVAQTGASGSLRIGYLEWGTIAFLEQLKRFIRDYPQCSVEVYRQRFSELREAISVGKIDVIFTTDYDCDQFSNDEYNMLKIQKVPLMAYMSMDNPLSERMEISIEELRAEPMLMIDQKSSPGFGNYIRKLFIKHNIHPHIAQYARDGGEHIGNILIGKGILLASKLFLDNTLERQIARVPVTGEDVWITAVWRHESKNLVLMKFLTKIHEEADEN